MTEAVDLLERSPAALERARALVELGAALRRERQNARSREPLRHGLELARSLGAQPLANRAHSELLAAGGRRRAARQHSGADSLTATERHVAELAAGDLSSRQIARALYLTPKTVDWHLGNAYRKLGINSRRQLKEAL
jgi:DNA-binding CsgD family transcriptional regulator